MRHFTPYQQPMAQPNDYGYNPGLNPNQFHLADGRRHSIPRPLPTHVTHNMNALQDRNYAHFHTNHYRNGGVPPFGSFNHGYEPNFGITNMTEQQKRANFNLFTPIPTQGRMFNSQAPNPESHAETRSETSERTVDSEEMKTEKADSDSYEMADKISVSRSPSPSTSTSEGTSPKYAGDSAMVDRSLSPTSSKSSTDSEGSKGKNERAMARINILSWHSFLLIYVFLLFKNLNLINTF